MRQFPDCPVWVQKFFREGSHLFLEGWIDAHDRQRETSERYLAAVKDTLPAEVLARFAAGGRRLSPAEAKAELAVRRKKLEKASRTFSVLLVMITVVVGLLSYVRPS
jgi:hypothetical protein